MTNAELGHTIIRLPGLFADYLERHIAGGECTRADTKARELGLLLLGKLQEDQTSLTLEVPRVHGSLNVELHAPYATAVFKNPQDMKSAAYTIEITESLDSVQHGHVTYIVNGIGLWKYREDLADGDALRVTGTLGQKNSYVAYGPDDKPSIPFDARLQSRVYGYTANLMVEATRAVLQAK